MLKLPHSLISSAWKFQLLYILNNACSCQTFSVLAILVTVLIFQGLICNSLMMMFLNIFSCTFWSFVCPFCKVIILIFFPLSWIFGLCIIVVVQLLSCIQLFVTLWTSACQASLSFTISRSLLRLLSIESMMPSKFLVLCHPLLLLPSIFCSIRVLASELALCIRWSKYWSFSFSISHSNNIQDWFPLGLTGLILQSKGLSRVFNTTIQKHQFFGAQPSLWFNSHVHT